MNFILFMQIIFFIICDLRETALTILNQLPVVYKHLAGLLKSYRDLSLNFQEFLAGDKTKFNLSLVLMDPSFDEMLNVIDSENAKFSGNVTECIGLLQTAKKLGIDFYRELFDIPVPIINASNVQVLDVIKAAQKVRNDDSEIESILKQIDVDLKGVVLNITALGFDRLIRSLDRMKAIISKPIEKLTLHTKFFKGEFQRKFLMGKEFFM